MRRFAPHPTSPARCCRPNSHIAGGVPVGQNERVPFSRDAHAEALLATTVTNIAQRYPYHDAHFDRGGEQPSSGVERHPAFGNSFDWHSSAHSHLTALRISAALDASVAGISTARGDQASGSLSSAHEARRVIEGNLTPEKLAVEAEYFAANASYERPYGWAWAIALAAEASRSTSEWQRALAAGLTPLAEIIESNMLPWLEVLPEPVRHGVHSNTAFSLGVARDGFALLGRSDAVGVIDAAARRWFARDAGWPAEWERSGNDFLSAGLSEADLMRRVLDPAEFAAWFERFLPGVDSSSPIARPVVVPDVDDGHIVHWHGLNLSRAAQLARIDGALAAGGAERDAGWMRDAARALVAASIDDAVHGPYVSTHWLATLAWDALSAIDGVPAASVVPAQ